MGRLWANFDCLAHSLQNVHSAMEMPPFWCFAPLRLKESMSLDFRVAMSPYILCCH